MSFNRRPAFAYRLRRGKWKTETTRRRDSYGEASEKIF